MLLLAITVWIAIGVVAVTVMHHRGHDTFAWAALFLFLGPLALPVAVGVDRNRPPEPVTPSHEGGLDVLVAHDGSAEAAAALDAVLRLVGAHMTSLTLAAVVDIEAATTVRGRDTRRLAQDRLDALARDVAAATTAPVDTVVLFGEASQALQHFAAGHDYELIVASGRSAGHTHHTGGGVGRKLARGTTVPVLTGPAVR